MGFWKGMYDLIKCPTNWKELDEFDDERFKEK